MPKQLVDRKTAVTLENRYLFEIRDLKLNSVGEYIVLLKSKIVESMSKFNAMVRENQRANAFIDSKGLADEYARYYPDMVEPPAQEQPKEPEQNTK